MKTILITLLLCFNLFAQEQVIMLFGSSNPVAGGSYTTYTAGATYTWLWTDANNPVDTIYDATANQEMHNIVSANQFTYSDSGLVTDGNDYMYTSTPSSLFTSGITIECVVFISDASTAQIFYGLRDATPYTCGFGINSNALVGTFYNGTDDLTYNGAITTGWHHLVMTWDNTTTFHVYVDGSEVTDAGNSYQYGGLIGQNRIAIGSDSGESNYMSANSIFTYWAVYANTILNGTQVANNYGSEIIQTSIPVWAR